MAPVAAPALLLVTLALAGAQEPLRPGRAAFQDAFVWRSVDFAWPHDTDKVRALDSRSFIPENCAVQGLRVWRDHLFLTLPRWRPGVPATLTTLPKSASHTAPALQPFPSWEMQTPGNCSALQSAQAIDITPDGFLWVVDGGRADNSRGPSPPCQPKILIFKLDERNVSESLLVRTMPIPQEGLSRGGESAFADIAVDGDTAFVSDASDSDPGIVVVDTQMKSAWKVQDASMRGDTGVAPPRGGLPSGVTALALTPRAGPSAFNADRVLYYAPLRSQQVFAVNASALKQAQRSGNSLGDRVEPLGNTSSFVQAMVADEHGSLYMGFNAIHAVARWEVARPANKRELSVLETDQERLQWLSALALDDAGFLWVASNRLDNFLTNGVNVDETNYRILKAYVGDAGRPGDMSGMAMPRPEPTPRHEPSEVLDLPGSQHPQNNNSTYYTTNGDHMSQPGHRDDMHMHATASAAPLAASAAVGALVLLRLACA